jgi:hypothetical protein
VSVFGSENGRELVWWCLLKDLLPYIFNKLLIIYIQKQAPNGYQEQHNLTPTPDAMSLTDLSREIMLESVF